MREKRARLVNQARELLNKAEEEKRDLTQEEENQYSETMKEVDSLKEKIDKEERLQREEAALDTPEERIAPPNDIQTGGQEQRQPRTLGELAESREALQERGVRSIRETEEYREAFNRWLAYGSSNVNSEEARAMQVDSDTGGGYLVTPQQMVMDLLKEVDDMVVVRQYANVEQLTQAKSLGIPTLDKDPDDADWTAELKTGQETELEFGKRELRPHPLAKRIKVSNTLLRMSNMGPEGIIRDRMAYKFGITQEKAYMTGDGHGKPLGLFTASDDGISTSRDVSDGNTATELHPDNLINAKYELKPAYRQRARWVLHRNILKEVRKMKDGNGQYLWQPGIAGGRPDTILELPFVESEYAPSTMTSDDYVALLGDIRFYRIVDALDLQMQRLVELYAENNQTGFIGRYEGDGMPVLEEAFVRCQLA